ncbi:bifunctional UDP-N-acetylglucosamine diphosphorylase/glucosamine-1-phosphate N-acetyltransferase GlmU [Candidatus Methylospira mobilis]|uniref:bifunctional UDP-N-acetylglucosamine diphosphorylase/glucosamine-1-phosphate N-acetyltransferase GlmU n=1 Tax=Candidatus Methylospira mobilis TaxID=1808979 RepID=UPI0028EFA746|nr:bifunctional UDP-N-acetylglucosamine diphosphorylase/glucosamine-1-phosphate N-acetyltransferase GlmU [Candidatus Methylospira mobilis]WNV05968.1 bifunctional UDP-N-acetylglucosamine diphosphorylase/glucosamine-1-phosphate N-acetyltransferase GlmU [Candidatus Methylospira mobilis]
MTIQSIILAAGQGTRMCSDIPKVLHRIGGKTMLRHVYDLACQQGQGRGLINIVYGHGGERILEASRAFEADWTLQKEQRGTGHAVLQAVDWIMDDSAVLILYGDVPLLEAKTVTKLLALTEASPLALLTVKLAQPYGYGRIVRDLRGEVICIVEEKDADDIQKGITEVNTGIMAVRGVNLKSWLGRITDNNAQGEFYLTDIIGLAVQDGVTVATMEPADAAEVMGINNREQLAHLERSFQLKIAGKLMRNGVTLRDPSRFDVRGEISVGRDVEIDVNVILEGRVSIGNNVKIGANVIISDSELGDDVVVQAHSIIESSQIGAGCRVGPYARLRPETVLDEKVHIGNFVEIKKTSVAQGSKINHLSYVGDAVVGANVNIGAGTITCNYDGANKHQTVIEDGAFIGSDTQLVAPVTVGKNATIGAGSTITRDAPQNALTISRIKQVSLDGWKRPEKKRN